jgi:hypothetical protein
MNKDIFPLFSSDIVRYKIDPNSYDKQGIIDTLTENYIQSPYRNKFDEISDLHHTYNDWDNGDFKEVDPSSIVPCYQKVIEDFFEGHHYSQPIKWRYEIENFTAMKGNQHMDTHSHVGIVNKHVVMFSCIHYIRYIPGQAETVFVNPISSPAFGFIYGDYSKKLVKTHENSTYFGKFSLKIQEDDFIIFPSYLEHFVKPGKNTEDLRMTSVVNIQVERECL